MVPKSYGTVESVAKVTCPLVGSERAGHVMAAQVI